MTLGTVVLLSPEPWDEVWRRNQHLCAELVRQQRVTDLLFVEPPRAGAGRRFRPIPGVRVLRPSLLVPRRTGGLRLVAASLKLGPLRSADLLWINDARLGALCLSRHLPAIYDVTDDWRELEPDGRRRRSLVEAEDALTAHAQVIVCSQVLRERWQERYAVRTSVVQNGVDRDAYTRASGRLLPGATPHVGYVGTLHLARIDLDLVLELARDPRIGTVHLIGPQSLSPAGRDALVAEPKIVLHGPVTASDVPQLLLSLDVLICPHLISSFTMSLDGIKSHEYLASGRPIVATATSGFQFLDGIPGVQIVAREDFADAVAHARPTGVAPGSRGTSWAERAAEFVAAIEHVQ